MNSQEKREKEKYFLKKYNFKDNNEKLFTKKTMNFRRNPYPLYEDAPVGTSSLGGLNFSFNSSFESQEGDIIDETSLNLNPFIKPTNNLRRSFPEDELQSKFHKNLENSLKTIESSPLRSSSGSLLEFLEDNNHVKGNICDIIKILESKQHIHLLILIDILSFLKIPVEKCTKLGEQGSYFIVFSSKEIRSIAHPRDPYFNLEKKYYSLFNSVYNFSISLENNMIFVLGCLNSQFLLNKSINFETIAIINSLTNNKLFHTKTIKALVKNSKYVYFHNIEDFILDFDINIQLKSININNIKEWKPTK